MAYDSKEAAKEALEGPLLLNFLAATGNASPSPCSATDPAAADAVRFRPSSAGTIGTVTTVATVDNDSVSAAVDGGGGAPSAAEG